MSRKSFRSKTIDLPGVAKVGNDAHRKELEASFKEENHSEDSIEVVKAVHEERLRFKPDEKRENNGLPKKSFLRNNKILPTNLLFLVSWQKKMLTKRPRGSSQRRRGGWGRAPRSQSTCPLSTCGNFKRRFFSFFLYFEIIWPLQWDIDFSLITNCTFFTERNPGDKSCDANLRTWIFAVCVCTTAARTETRGRRYSTDKS